MRVAIAAAVVLAVFGILTAIILSKEKQETKFHRRLTHFSKGEADPEAEMVRGLEEEPARRPLSERLLKRIQKTAVHLPEFSLTKSLDARMDMADWPFLGRDYLVILATFGVIDAVVFGLLMFDAKFAVFGFLLSIVIGFIILDISIQRRRKAFVNQLGDMLTMVANALRAGFSFMQAFELIAREMDAPVGREVAKVIREVNLGASLDAALDHMSKRMQSPDFNLVVTAVLIQRQVGGNLAEILDTISSTIQERIRMRREVFALTAQGRMSGIVLSLLPFGLAFAIRMVNPGYLDPLLTDFRGQMAVGAAIVLILIGYVVIQRIVDIKP